MEIEEDRWLSQRLGRSVFDVRPGDGGFEPDALSRHREGSPEDSMYQARVPPNGEELRRLLDEGFGLVSIDVTFVRAPDQGEVADPVDVRDAELADVEAIREIASSSFSFDRFHADPRIDDDVADRVKADWAESCVRGDRGAGVLVATDEGRPVGFLAVIEREADGRVRYAIDLVAVAPGYRGRGFGRRLGEAFIARFDERADQLAVGTQLANTVSIRGYQALGFGFDSAACSLHLHEDGSVR